MCHAKQTTLKSVQLNPSTILAHATQILAEYGLADLTMRRLARSLDVAPGALYWHFPSKQELLGAIANQLLAGVQPPETTPGARLQSRDEWTQIVDYCVAIYSAMTSLRDGAEITLAALASGTTERDLRADVRETAGSFGEIAFHYVLGAAMDVQAQQAVASALGDADAALATTDAQHVRRNVEVILAPLLPG